MISVPRFGAVGSLLLALPCHQRLPPVHIVVWPLLTWICGMVCFLFHRKKKTSFSKNTVYFMDLALKVAAQGGVHGVLRSLSCCCTSMREPRESHAS